MTVWTKGPSTTMHPVAPRYNSFYLRYGKRAFDFCLSSLGLVLASPILLLCCVAIKWTSAGPIFFRQERLGRNGIPFRILKFRTMNAGATGAKLTCANDVRVTRVGKVLRRWKLDELPQLINVLLGDMSLIGPRARVPELVPSNVNSGGAEILSVRPGITSLGTLCYRGQEQLLVFAEEFSSEPWLDQKVNLDRLYLRNVSLGVDLQLLLHTLLLLYVPGIGRHLTVNLLGRKINIYSRWMKGAVDLGIFTGAVAGSYWLRFEGEFSTYRMKQLLLFLLVLPFLRSALSHTVGMYRQLWRYTSLASILQICATHIIPSFALLTIRVSAPTQQSVWYWLSAPLSVIALEYFITCAGCIGARTLRHALYTIHGRYHPSVTPHCKRILLVTASSMGADLADVLRKQIDVEVIGFVDDDTETHHLLICGFPVLGSLDEIPKLVRGYGVSEVIICTRNKGVLERVRNFAKELPIKVNFAFHGYTVVERRVASLISLSNTQV